MSKSKYQDLTTWLDYFKMLQQYEQKGLLQMNPADYEAYITRAALLTLVPEAVSSFKFQVSRFKFQDSSFKFQVSSFKFQDSRKDAQQEPETRNLKPETNDKALIALLNRLRAYAGWKAAAADPSVISHQPSYISSPFATHIVKEDYPHDLLLTLLLQQKRSWRTAWRTVDTIEAIDYTEKGNPT